MNNYENTIESFINFCDDMKIVEEGLFSNKSNTVKEKIYSSLDEIFQNDDNLKYSKNKKYFKLKDELDIFFADGVLTENNRDQIKKIFNKIMSSEKKIVSLLSKKLQEDGDNVSDTMKVNYIEFYLNENNKLDASVGSKDSNQYNIVDVVSKGFNMSNIEYFD